MTATLITSAGTVFLTGASAAIAERLAQYDETIARAASEWNRIRQRLRTAEMALDAVLDAVRLLNRKMDEALSAGALWP